MKAPDLAKLAQRLGHSFAEPTRLEQALTHPSASTKSRPDNQRMEFLGDRVLGLVIAEALMKVFPDLPEGELAPRFNALVRREALAEVAEQIGLGQFLRLGRSESTAGGRRKGAILADAMEATIAALYQDGGLEVARSFILANWAEQMKSVEIAPTDAKTRAQEWAQARGMAPPEYVTVSRKGPDHAPIFTVEATLAGLPPAKGTAKSKKLAEQDAATALLAKVSSDG